MSYREHLIQSTSYPYTVTIWLEQGWRVEFLPAGGLWSPVFTGQKDTLVDEGSTWLYTTSDYQRYRFDSSGRLLSIEYVDGDSVSLSYAGTVPDVVTVTDNYGNEITLVLDDVFADKVASMVDPDGNEYRYKYDDNGNIRYVSFPDTTPNTAGDNEWGEDNPVREYRYEHPNQTAYSDHLITSIHDENGDLYKTIVYDDTVRAVESGLADGSYGNSVFDYSQSLSDTDPRITVTDPLGRQTVYHRIVIDKLALITDVEGADQPSIGCLADVRSKEYYPDTGWLKIRTDKAGNATYYEYYSDSDRYGQVRKRIEGLFSTEQRTFEYDWYPDRQIKSEELLGVKKTEYTYHTNGREHTRTETDLTNEADVATRIWTTTYSYHDAPGNTQVATMTMDGPRPGTADSTITEYNTSGFTTKVTDAEGHQTLYRDHNGRGQPEEVEDANGIITELEYHPRGWLDKITQDAGPGPENLNAVTDLHYDNVGQLTGITLADGVHVTFRYDEGHRLYETENDLGEIIKYELDAAGNQEAIKYKDELGTVVQTLDYDFDGLSRLWREFGSYGQQTDYTYDEKDHLTTIDDGVNPVTSQFFDAQNRVDKVTNADNDDLFIEYDAEDRIDQVTDQRGLVTDYVYDGFGDLQKLISPDTGTTLYDYDAAGNRTKQTDARGVVTQYVYDDLNRLTHVDYADNSKDITYLYDNWTLPGAGCDSCEGRLAVITDSSGSTAYIYDRLGRVDIRVNTVNVPGAPPVELTTDFDFNAAGRLAQVTYPGGKAVTYGFDDAGQIDTVGYEVEDPNNPGNLIPNDLLRNVQHQPFGPMRQADYDNGLQLSRVYDQDGRLDTQTVLNISDPNAPQTLQSLDYGYDGVNNVETITNLVDATRTEDFTYDNLNRLETAGGRYGDITYGYDEVGNRKSRTIVRDGGALTITETYLYPGDPNAPMDPNEPNSNRLKRVVTSDGSTTSSRDFEYDAAGNRTKETRDGQTHMTLEYDDTGRLESVTP